MALTTDMTQSHDRTEPAHWLGELPDAEVMVVRPFNVQLSDGTILPHGELRTIRGADAEYIVATGRGYYVKNGPPAKTEPAVKPQPTVSVPQAGAHRFNYPFREVPRSGQTARVRIKHGFSIEIDGKVFGTGEHVLPVEVIGSLGSRIEPMNVLKPRPPAPYRGAMHPVRILGTPAPGCGVWSVALDRQLQFGEDVELPEPEADIMIAMLRAKSLRPEQPDPAAVELADIVAGKDKANHAKVVTLASRLLKRTK